MKKLIYIIGLGILFSLSSCDETLDVDIPSEKHEIETVADIHATLVGCYNGLQRPMKDEWLLTELRSDNAVQGNPGSRSEQNIRINELDMFTLLPTHPTVYDYWLSTYANIEQVNKILASLDVLPTVEEQNSVKAQCTFIRAYHYFNLVRLFGPVFIITDKITPMEAKSKQRSSVDDVYAQIVEDLSFAADDQIKALPEKWNTAELGRVSRLAAKGLLAKVYLTTGNLVSSRILLEEVIATGKHQLVSYKDVFSINSEMSDEILFSIRYTAGGFGIGSPFANNFAPTSSGSNIVNGDGKGWNFPSYEFMSNAYEANDARQDITVSTYGNATWVKNYVNKYVSPVSITEDADNDWPILRYADIVLMLAEIINEQEGHTNALPLVNEVRATHGNLAALALINSQSDMRLAIEKERRVEFAFENQRFFDLVRTGRALDVLNEQFFVTDKAFYDRFKELTPDPALVVQEWQLLLPIPQREIDTNNMIRIAQNEGY